MASMMATRASTTSALPRSPHRSSLGSFTSRRSHRGASVVLAAGTEVCDPKSPHAPCSVTAPTTLSALAMVSSVQADTAHLEMIERHANDLTGAITNPSLILMAATTKTDGSNLMEHIVRHASSGRVGGSATFDNRVDAEGADVELSGMSESAEGLTVDVGCEITKLLAKNAGVVSTELDTGLAYAPPRVIIDRAKRLMDLYVQRRVSPQRVMIMLPATYTGIEACQKLERDGIACNMTLSFSMAQAIACADAGASVISPYVGRICDWHAARNGDAPVLSGAGGDAGVRFVKRVYAYYKSANIPTRVLAASIRTPAQALQLAGVDIISCPPSVLEELAATTTDKAASQTVVRHLSPASIELPADVDLDDNVPIDSYDEEFILSKCLDDTHIPVSRLRFLDEKQFWMAHHADEMASEMLTAGISQFQLHTHKLETLMAKMGSGAI